MPNDPAVPAVKPAHGFKGGPERRARLLVLCDYYHRLGVADWSPSSTPDDPLADQLLCSPDLRRNGQLPEIAPVICEAAPLDALIEELGPDVLRWALLADSPSFQPIKLSESLCLAAWRHLRRCESQWQKMAWQDRDQPFSAPAPHKAISLLRKGAKNPALIASVPELPQLLGAVAPRTASRLWPERVVLPMLAPSTSCGHAP